MWNKLNISLKIWSLVLLSAILFFIIALFWYQDYSSIKEFLSEFIVWKNLILLFFIFWFSIFIWFISSFFIKNIFNDIELYNKKLKDYNHFLAHELKTPIAVINSNLEVLKYGFDEWKINDSKNELKNITKIIDWLLNFSESFNNLDKKELNVENFIKWLIWFNNNNINIVNTEFNFSIVTDDLLFERVVKNLIENAVKYSINKKVDIYIKKDRLVFINSVYKTLEKEELDMIFNKFYSKTCNENTWNGLWLPMIKEITKVLWFDLIVESTDNEFIVEIVY